MRSASVRAIARSVWTWARPLLGAAVLAVLVWQLGTGPFLEGVRAIDGTALAAAFALGAVATACCAWRWQLVASGFGIRLQFRAALAACYRAQFLNLTLPGGVAGDVHRAVSHGRDLGDMGRGVRAVVVERAIGHVTQIVIALVVLAVMPSPVRSKLPLAAAVVVTAAFVAVVLTFAFAGRLPLKWLDKAGSQLSQGLREPRLWAGAVLLSAAVLVSSLASFLIAARVAGATAPLAQLIALTLFSLMAMGVPVHVAGWGLREGAAAWAFAAAGLTATQGVAAAATYGVLVLAASLPGAAVLVFGWLSRQPRVAAASAYGDANG